jgi:hypothetical protein
MSTLEASIDWASLRSCACCIFFQKVGSEYLHKSVFHIKIFKNIYIYMVRSFIVSTTEKVDSLYHSALLRSDQRRSTRATGEK